MKMITPFDWLSSAVGKRLLIDVEASDDTMLLTLMGFDMSWLVVKGEDNRIGVMNRSCINQMSVYEEDESE